MTIKPGTKLGRYEIRSKIGEGGMGEVYLAQDTKLDRKVALKILPEGLARHNDRMRRFTQEAKAAAALNHPNIAHIYEIGSSPIVREAVEPGTASSEEIHFIAMEFIDGETLRHVVFDTQADLPKLLRYAQQIAEGLAKAHAAGIVHRDLKPDNIMVTREGHAKILDFGLAKLIDSAESERGGSEAPTRLAIRTDPGTVMGTPIYMSPEQARGMKVDARTDIFSFGVLLYEAVAKHLPFDGSNANEILARILSDKEPPPLARHAREVPPELQRIISKTLRKDPNERYQTIKDLLLDLKSLRQDLEFQHKLEGSLSPGPKKETDAPVVGNATVLQPAPATVAESRLVTRGRIIVAAGLVALVIAAIGYFYLTRPRSAAINSIAVLPFTNANADQDTDFLADGITDNIIERLSQLPNLKVMSHSAVFHYKGQAADPRTIANQLGVEAVLTGRLVKRNDTLIIDLELVDTKDNSHIWGERYERKLSDLRSGSSYPGADEGESLQRGGL